MEFICRRIKPEESLQYRHIRLESLRLHPECFGANYQAQSELEKLFFQQQIEQGSAENIMLGAFTPGGLAGLCGIVPVDDRHNEIIQMYVSASARGKGIAGKLLELALETSIKPLELTVYRDNTAAMKIYQSAGFTVQEQQGSELIMRSGQDR